MGGTAKILAPWGSLPAEQYLIRKWDQYPALAPLERRHQLIRDFLALDLIPSEWDAVRPVGPGTPRALDIRTPTEAEIETILRPWRPASVRSLAAHIWATESGDDFVDSTWIRTFYDPNQDEVWNDLLSGAPDNDLFTNYSYPPSQGLSEPSIFSSPGLTPEQAWNRALFFLPEFASRVAVDLYDRDLNNTANDDYNVELRAEAQAEVRELGFPVTRHADEGCSGVDSYTSLKSLQMNFTSRNVVIVDAEALETGKVCVLALDVKGNVVRWWRFEPEEILSELDTYAHEAMLLEAGWLEETEGVTRTGEKYKPDGGELAGLVYGFTGGEGDED